jgi:hypothetical protein
MNKATLTLALLSLLLTFWVVNYETSRKNSVVQAESGPEKCPVVFTANNVPIYRCEDWEMATVCYWQTNGMLFCVKE